MEEEEEEEDEEDEEEEEEKDDDYDEEYGANEFNHGECFRILSLWTDTARCSK